MAQGILKQQGWAAHTDVITMSSGYTLYGTDNYVYEKDGIGWLLLSITKSDQTAFAQTRHTVGTVKSEYLPVKGCNSVCGASNGINSFLNRNVNVILSGLGQIIVDDFASNDVKQISVIIMYALKEW